MQKDSSITDVIYTMVPNQLLGVGGLFNRGK